MSVPRVRLFGFELFAGPMGEAIGEITRHLGSPVIDPMVVVPVNAQLVGIADKHNEFRKALTSATLLVPDGASMLLAARLTGQQVTERIPGRVLFERLCEESARAGWKVFLVGDTPDVLDRARHALEARYPGLAFAGTHAPPFPFPKDAVESDDVVRMIRKASTDVVFVALGAPRQELWIKSIAERSGARLLMGVGGAIRMAAGDVPIAPVVWQRIGAEWLWRWLHEPRRLFWRYTAGNIRFAWILFKELLHPA